jgi:hypothetical protein
MTTLVSHRQPSLPNIYHNGSQGKSSRYKEPQDYFPPPIESQEKTLQDLDIGSVNSYHHHRKSIKSLVLQPICDYKEMDVISKEEEEMYVPPPLSPARKNREVLQSLRLEPDNNKRRYTHSMVSSPCNEDMGEFVTTSDTFDLFQKQQALNNSMLTSFKELGDINPPPPMSHNMTMNHSTSSLLLPLPFEFDSSHSLSDQTPSKREFK